MSKQPEVLYERIATLNKIIAIPDARFKSGYRSRKLTATTTVVFPEGIDGMQIAQNHIYKEGNKMTQTYAHSMVTFTLETRELPL
jgi:hypothetical protein